MDDPDSTIGAADVARASRLARRAIFARLVNLITVRSDVWCVVVRAQILNRKNEPVADRAFYAVIDRSFEPARVILFKWLPVEIFANSSRLPQK